MGKTSRDKGARGEREAAAFLSQWFPAARRGVSQTRSGNDGADVEGVYGLWVEVKRYAKLVVAGWMRKAESDLSIAATQFPRPGVVPIVLMREDKGSYIVACDATWFFNEFVAARPWLKQQIENKNGESKS